MPYTLVRWVLTDTDTSETYTFAVNPNTGGSPTYQKQFEYEATTAGATLIFEGRDHPQKIEFSGTLLEQEQYDAFVTWYQKRTQLLLTDDLGRTFTMLIESFTPTRKRNAIKPWMHDYKVSATLTVGV